MHELTVSESTVLLSVLSRGRREETSDLGPSGIPTSTFYAIRRKIYDEGWAFDRYVPNPWALGFHAVDCVLVRPGPIERVRWEQEWSASPQNVLLWSGLNVLLGVFFRREGETPVAENGATISVTGQSGALPVYFDYSRPWSRFTRVERETGYPRALETPADPPARVPVATVKEFLLQDGGNGNPAGRSHRWHSSASLSQRQRGLLERGLVVSRTFLDLEAVPAYDARKLGEVVFLTGALRPGSTARDVLAALNNECRVSPLLLADDGTRILIVALGQVESSSGKRSKLPRAAEPVSRALDARMEGLQMTVERVDGLRRPVDHRYDRLFPRTEPAGE